MDQATYTVELAKKAKRVVAVDLSPEMLKKAQNKAEKAGVKNIQFLQSNGTNIQLEDSSVDMILLVTVYHEVGESEAVLKEFNRILKPEGKADNCGGHKERHLSRRTSSKSRNVKGRN